MYFIPHPIPTYAFVLRVPQSPHLIRCTPWAEVPARCRFYW